MLLVAVLSILASLSLFCHMIEGIKIASFRHIQVYQVKDAALRCGNPLLSTAKVKLTTVPVFSGAVPWILTPECGI